MPRVWRARRAQPVNDFSVLKVAEAKVSFYRTKSSFYPAHPQIPGIPGIVRIRAERTAVVEATDDSSTAYCSQRSRCSSVAASPLPRSFYPVKRDRNERLRSKMKDESEETGETVKEKDKPEQVSVETADSPQSAPCEESEEAQSEVNQEVDEQQNQEVMEEVMEDVKVTTGWIRLPDQGLWADSLEDSDEEAFCGLANWQPVPDSQTFE